MYIGTNLRTILSKLSFDFKTFADKCEIAPQRLTLLLRNQPATDSEIERICMVLGMAPDVLVDGPLNRAQSMLNAIITWLNGANMYSPERVEKLKAVALGEANLSWTKGQPFGEREVRSLAHFLTERGDF